MDTMPEIHYQRLQPLAAEQRFSLAVVAALAGCTPATILVDDVTHPQAAFLQVVHRLYLLGSAGNDAFNHALHDYLAGVLVPARQALGHHWLSVYDDADDWHAALPRLFPGAELHATERIYLARPSAPATGAALLPPGYQLQPVDGALMARTELLNHDRLAEELCSERHSVEEFLAHSFGVCVLAGDELAGWCLSEYNCGDRCEVGIETTEPHRGRGLATAMTAALCATAHARGVTTVGWHCIAANVPSYATARKAGFEELCRSRSHYVRIGG